MSAVFILGTIAGTLCTISFVPQVVRAYKTKNTKDLSLGTFVIFSIGLVLWTVYGFILNQPPIIIANIATLLLTTAIVVLKIKYQ